MSRGDLSGQFSIRWIGFWTTVIARTAIAIAARSLHFVCAATARRQCRTSASSRYRQNALASWICRGVRHSGSNRSGDATRTQMQRAREVATLSRLRL